MNIKKGLFVMVLTALVAYVAPLFAYGPHDSLDCLGCHDPHYAKAQKIFKVKNEVLINPRTGKKVDDVSALCLGCHNIKEFGGAGIKPIHPHMTHPINIQPNPVIAQVPEFLLRNEMLQCVSCHDPHPSNPNWKYLRINTDGGGEVGQFCLMCHPAKADAVNFYSTPRDQLQVFSSMNETQGAKVYAFNDPQLITNNVTPVYIQAFGDYENTRAPAYTTAATQPWIYKPNPDRVPEYLRKYLKSDNTTNTNNNTQPAPANDTQTQPAGQ